MDDWTYRYSDVDAPDKQSMLPDQDGRVMEERRVRAGRAEAARAAGLEQTQAVDPVANRVEAGVPLPSATAPAVALTF